MAFGEILINYFPFPIFHSNFSRRPRLFSFATASNSFATVAFFASSELLLSSPSAHVVGVLVCTLNSSQQNT